MTEKIRIKQKINPYIQGLPELREVS